MRPNPLRLVLDQAYEDYHLLERRSADAIHLVHQFDSPADREIVALFSALLAYGNVSSILKSIQRLIDTLKGLPYDALLNRRFSKQLGIFCHRFTTGQDIEILFHQVGTALESHGSLEAFFLHTNPQPSVSSFPMDLTSFVHRLRALPLPSRLKKLAPARARNLKYLLSSPEDGSACKRLNLFLRWMVRPADGIDLGQWTQVSPAILRLPVDTHLLRVLQELEWTASKTANWKVVEEATMRLRELNPEDPVRYDFALCHLSMQGFSIKQYLGKDLARGQA